jgi:hypothetical protein
MSLILTRLEHARATLAVPSVWVNYFPLGPHECMASACHGLERKTLNLIEIAAMPSYVGAINALIAALPPGYDPEPGCRPEQAVWNYNDAPGRTLEEVLAVFDKAIAAVKATSEESAQSASAQTQSI